MIATLLLAASTIGQVAAANVRPQIGYVYPPGAKAGTTIEVMLGTYDWTPDMQVFSHDPRIKIEITGPAGEPILTPPPYWFGAKAGQAQPPLAREVPARITIPAEVLPGPVKWQAANANGGTNVGTFIVADGTQVVEPEYPIGAVDLPALPIAISGRLSKITEIDAYRFTVPESGLVSVQLDDRLGQPFHGVLSICDAAGELVTDAADTTGSGASVVFAAQAGASYTARVHDAEFGGDRGYVYRLSIARGPKVVTTLPQVVHRGFSGNVECIGWGVASGTLKLESISQPVSVPAGAAAEAFAFGFETPTGRASAWVTLGDGNDMIEPTAAEIAARQLVVPNHIAGTLDALDAASQMPLDRFQFTAKKDDMLRLHVAAGRGSTVDPTLVIVGADGKEIARNDDQPGGTDAAVDFKAPADGAYDVLVSDVSGVTPSRAGTYRLVVENSAAVSDFTLQTPTNIDLPLGGKVPLAIKVARRGSWKQPIALRLEGLPEGVAHAADAAIPEGKSDLGLELTTSDQAAASASLVAVVATANVEGRVIERRSQPILIATTLKTRCQVASAVQDGGRLVNRGTTYPSDVVISRLEGYAGPVTLQMAAAQQRQRRGMRSTPLVVPADAATAQFPIFVPEWLETSLTCRMNVIGVVQVADPKGNVRHVTGNMDGLIVMSIEGALLKLTHEAAERTAALGSQIEIPVRVSRNAKLPVETKIEVVSEGEFAGMFTADPIVLPVSQSETFVKVRLSSDARLAGQRQITIRGTALEKGLWPTVSETHVPVLIEAPAAVAGQ